MNKLLQMSIMLTGLFLGVVLSACGAQRSWPAMTGQVFEQGTERPIEGAIVVVRWQGNSGIVDTQSVCFHVETTATNAQGSYKFSAWRAEERWADLGDPEVMLIAYKPGYQKADIPLGVGKTYLQLFTGTREERFKATRIAGVNCNGAGKSERNLLPLYRAIYYQLHALAVTKEEKSDAIEYLHSIDIIELPYEEALKRDLERREALDNEKQ